MSGDRSFHLIEAVADRIEGAPVAARRRWSDAFKAEMAARSCEAGANVSALAREIGISPSQLFGWRSVLVRKGEIERRSAAGGVVRSEPQTAPSPMIEIDVNGMTVRASPSGEGRLVGLSRVLCNSAYGQQ
jgi:transposase